MKLLLESELKLYIYSYILTVVFLNPAVIFLSLQYSTIYYIFLFSIIVWLILLKKDMLTYISISTFFFSVGCLTSYFDFLTYPVVTLGVLCILSIQTFGMNRIYFKTFLKKILLWSYGYLGMWMGKWLVGSITLKKNLYKDALQQILLRTSTDEIQTDRLNAIKENLNVLNNNVYVFNFFALLIFMLFKLYKKKINITKLDKVNICYYIIIASIPFLWCWLSANHSFIHSWFVHRVFAICILATSSLCTYIIYDSEITSNKSCVIL